MKSRLEIVDKEKRLLQHLASRVTLPIVEIGCYKGASTLAMSATLRKGNKIYAIDNHQFDSFEDFTKNIYGRTNIIPINKSSKEANINWKKKLSIVFIDGDHSYHSTYLDVVLWTPYLAHGGFVVMHDTSGLTYKGVEKVVKDFIFASGLFKVIGFVGSMTIAQRKDLNIFDKIGNKILYVYWITFKFVVKLHNMFIFHILHNDTNDNGK